MNELKHKAEFHKLLDGYRLSDESLLTLSQTKLVLLAAPTSSGRNTIIKQVLKTGDYYFIVSDTTRQPRVNDGVLEQNGVEYWFRKETDVLEDIRDGKYLEAAVIHDQQVSGISVRELQKATDAGKIAITDAEIAGVRNAVHYKHDTIPVFIVPPSFDEWQHRLKHRGHMEPDEFKRRMESAVVEFQDALDNDYYRFVINDTVENAAEQVNRLAKLDEFDTELQVKGRQLIERLIIDTRALITSL
jgi:guanylate kinase